MAEPFLGEIRLCSFNIAPKGWALCNGQLLPIAQNQGLFALLGTTYGGDGRVNFALPDLRGRRAIQEGAGYTRGQRGGSESHTLNVPELPEHRHAMQASSDAGTLESPVNAYLAASLADVPYAAATAPVMGGNVTALQKVGGSQAHENRPPFLVLNYIIALQGIFPSPN